MVAGKVAVVAAAHVDLAAVDEAQVEGVLVDGDVDGAELVGAGQAGELLDDVAAVFIAPLPGGFEKFIAADFALAAALGD